MADPQSGGLIVVPTADAATYTYTVGNRKTIPVNHPGGTDKCLPRRVLSDSAFSAQWAALGGLVQQPLTVVAHRCYADEVLQYTLRSVLYTIQRGCDYLDFDCQISSDKVWFNWHDNDLTGTSGSGTFREHNAAYIDAVRQDNTAGTVYASDGIQRFSTILPLVAASGKHICIEVKGYETEADIDILYNQIVAAGLLSKAFFCSTTFSDLEYIRANLDATVRLGYVSSDPNNIHDHVDDTAALGGVTEFVAKYTITDADLISYCASEGVDLSCWTINNWAGTAVQGGAGALLDLGVRKMFCDGSIFM